MTPLYRLVRVLKSTEGTAGVLLNPELLPICNTVEPPWKENRVNVSCIPEGLYMAHRRMRHAGQGGEYEVFELENVPGRTVVQLHIANEPAELEGCIAPVTYWLDRKFFGCGSNDAFGHFMRPLKNINRIALKITSSCVQTRDVSSNITNLGEKR